MRILTDAINSVSINTELDARTLRNLSAYARSKDANGESINTYGYVMEDDNSTSETITIDTPFATVKVTVSVNGSVKVETEAKVPLFRISHYEGKTYLDRVSEDRG